MLILKNLLRRKVRSLLSLLGVAVGIAAIVSFSAVASGFKTSFTVYFGESEAQLLLICRDVVDPSMGRIGPEDVKRILALPGVEEVCGTTFYQMNLIPGMPALFLFGRDPKQRLMEKYQNRDFQGRMFEGAEEVMVGHVLASVLRKGPGDTVPLFGKRFRISGVYKTATTWENAGLLIHNSVLQERMKMGDNFGVGYIYLNDPSASARIGGEIEKALPHLRAIRPRDFLAYFDQFEYVDWFVWIVSLISVFVGGLGVLNTMLMAVSERVREIGTLRAVGWGKRMVLRMILGEGLVLSGLGGAAGMLLGWAAAEVAVRTAPPGFLSTNYDPMHFLQAGVVALVLGFFGSLYPAWQASRLSPIEALKYE